MDITMEIAKTQAMLNNVITSLKAEAEGKAEVDVLGSLLALRDMLDRIDTCTENL